ncbi:MAG: hypothetical protein RLZ33_455 [Bacteroidota bacterium]|jgi:hypothetical protein
MNFMDILSTFRKHNKELPIIQMLLIEKQIIHLQEENYCLLKQVKKMFGYNK